MASQQGSRNALIGWVVAMSVVALGSLIFGFIQLASANKSAEELTQLKSRYEEIALPGALTGPDVVQLKEAKTAEGSGFSPSDKLLNVALKQRDDLVKLLTGSVAAPNAALGQTTETLTRVAERVKASGLEVDPASTSNVNALLASLSATIENQAGQIQRLAETVKQAKANEAATIKRTADQMAVKDEQMAKARADGNAAISLAQDDRAGKQGVIEAISKDIETERREFASREQEMTAQLGQKDRQINQLNKDLSAVRSRLGDLRLDPAGATVRKPDARVVRVTGRDTLYISLGSGDQVTPGLTFEIFDRLEGVPALPGGDPASNANLPTGKASVEVVRVGATSSECRIIRTDSQQRPVVEGDLASNLVFDPAVKFRFKVFGKFDLDRNGIATAGDAEVVRRLIEEWGGQLTDDVNVDTDFVVLGSEPTLPEFSPQDAADPINARLLADAQRDLAAYQQVVTTARELSIPIMNQNRFLHYVGFYERSAR